MKRRQYLLLLVTTVIAGLVGGAISNHLLVRTAAAQNLTAHGNITSLKAFRLVDENGQLRAALEMSDGEPGLKFYDEVGNPTVDLHGSRGLIFYDKAGNASITLEIDSDSSRLALNGIDGKSLAALYASSDSSSLLIGDENGILRAGLGMCASGKYGLEFFDEDGALMGRFSEDRIWPASTPSGKMISIWGMIKKADR